MATAVSKHGYRACGRNGFGKGSGRRRLRGAHRTFRDHRQGICGEWAVWALEVSSHHRFELSKEDVVDGKLPI